MQPPEMQAPTSAQVRVQAAAGDALTCAVAVSAAGNLTGCAVVGLTEVTRYSAFYTVQDAAHPTPNLHAPAIRFDFTTADGTPPIGSLALGEVAADGFKLLGESTKNGTVVWVVVPAGAPPPTFRDIRTGRGGSGARPAAAGNFAVSGSGAILHGHATRSLTVGVASGSGDVHGLTHEVGLPPCCGVPGRVKRISTPC